MAKVNNIRNPKCHIVIFRIKKIRHFYIRGDHNTAHILYQR